VKEFSLIDLEITNFQKRYFKLVVGHTKAGVCDVKLW